MTVSANFHFLQLHETPQHVSFIGCHFKSVSFWKRLRTFDNYNPRYGT